MSFNAVVQKDTQENSIEYLQYLANGVNGLMTEPRLSGCSIFCIPDKAASKSAVKLYSPPFSVQSCAATDALSNMHGLFTDAIVDKLKSIYSRAVYHVGLPVFTLAPVHLQRNKTRTGNQIDCRKSILVRPRFETLDDSSH